MPLDKWKNRGVWENKLASQGQDDSNADLTNSKACVLFISSQGEGYMQPLLLALKAAVGSFGPC